MNPDEMLTNLAERTTRLERSTRIWRASTIGLGFLLGAAILGGARQPAPVTDVLRTRTLEIVGERGDVLAALGQDRFGGLLAMYNARGQRTASIEANSAGGLITVADKAGRIRAAAQTDDYGGMFVVYGQNDRKAAAIEVGTLGGLVCVNDQEARASAALDVTARGGRVVVNGPDQHAAVVLARDDRGTGLAFVNNSTGQQVFLVGANDAGDGMLNTLARDGKPLITLGSTGREPLLSIFDSRGAEAVQAGVMGGSGRVEVRDRQGNRQSLRP